MMMLMMTSAEIVELRERFGLTLKAFGELLDVSESTVCSWERGTRHPAWKHLVKLNELANPTNGKKKQKATA